MGFFYTSITMLTGDVENQKRRKVIPQPPRHSLDLGKKYVTLNP